MVKRGPPAADRWTIAAVQLNSACVVAEEREDGSVALIAGSEVEKDDAVRAAAFERRKADDIPVEGGHGGEVSAANGDLAKGGDFKRGGLDIGLVHGESLARTALRENPKMTLPQTMRAIEIKDGGGPPSVLTPCERPVPTPGADQILIRVAAAGVNRPDVLQRSGSYPPPPGASDLPGLEAAGEVVAVGASVDRWAVGDKVCALLAGGGYAEYAVTHQDHALPVPEGFSMAEAAALPETFFTVWTNVFDRGGLKAGETFLVHGGSSGIGTTAIQLGVAFGARVFTTVGNAEKAALCRELGAEIAVNYRDEDFVDVLRKATGGKGVDLTLDMVGGDYIPRNVKLAADQGRIAQIAFLQSPIVELNFVQIMLKRLTFTGSTLRPRSVEEKAAIARRLQDKVWPLLEAGRVRPVMHSEFALEDAAKAHELMETSTHLGKIMLTV